MCLNRFLLMVSIAALIIIGLPVLAIAYAQDGTPPPATSTPFPTARPAAMIAAVPLAETFDSALGWAAEGAWHYEPLLGESGGGWFVDTSQRETISTLTYQSSIDLTGTLDARLMYRQNGYLPTSDFVAVDISLDGGGTWVMLDMQVGVEAAWEMRSIELSDYRGQIVLLRFRVHSGAAPQEVVEVEQVDGYFFDDPEPASLSLDSLDAAGNTVDTVESAGDAVETAANGAENGAEDGAENGVDMIAPLVVGDYGIDNLTIQFFERPASHAMLPVPVYRRTLMGLHLVVGAQSGPVVGLATRLRDIGWPLGTLKGTSGTEDVLNAVATVSPDTVIIYRSLETPWGLIDCPNQNNDPVAEAQLWVNGLQPYWDRVQADYYELMNECQPPAWWLRDFTIEAMRIASSYNECLLVFSFAPGNPEPAYYQELWPVYEFALANPCQSGRYHGIALHAYGVAQGQMVSDTGPAIGLRHRMFYEALIQQIPEAVYLDVYYTEMGPGNGMETFACEDIAHDVLRYTAQLEYDPYVRGFNLWNLGRTDRFVDITECIPTLSDAVVSYYVGK